ncbi:MAG: orotidine-5'-phosphate decarboxylase [Alcanivoracaceae bacterium]|nr:orotidine-5'-phosphate decarboxylase [Alcanivoracaceae bacterium]
MSKSPLIVALDYDNPDDALAMAGNLDPQLIRVKVGKELFTRTGPVLVERLVAQGFDVFLDLKFHDIPNTVAGAVRAASALGVWMVNVHASGGRRMMEAARDALAGLDDDQRPLLTAVTVLTSMGPGDLAEIGVDVAPMAQVARLARLASESGLDGVVCSAAEAGMLRAELGPDFALVTPGIRPAGADAGDQTRVLTPSQAVRNGVDYIVVGRPVTRAGDPAAAAQSILDELSA